MSGLLSKLTYRPPSSLRESDLTMPRRKPSSVFASIAFRLARLARAIGLEMVALRFFLKASWVFWRLAYEISSSRIGPDFDTATRGITEDLLRRTIPPGGVVLDLGCGGGRLTRMAAPHAARVVGVDMSAENLERARAAGVPPNVQYICGDGRAVAAESHYDVVLVVHVLEHIANPDEFLQTIREQASTLIVEVPNFEADALNSVRVALGSPFFIDADHVREYTAPILRAQLERNGFVVREEVIRGASLIAVAAKA